MLVSSTNTSGVGKPTYAKVTAIDSTTRTLTVDAWTNGTPTADAALLLDGWVADLPRSQKMREIFTPDVLIHNLWRSRKSSKHFGWIYQCILDYARYLDADTLFLIKPMLAMRTTDELILIPRRDAPQFQYPVFISSPISLSLFGRSPGYSEPVFVFDGKYPLASWPLIDGYGTNYADNYGTSL
jgi:hypothetical protein